MIHNEEGKREDSCTEKCHTTKTKKKNKKKKERKKKKQTQLTQKVSGKRFAASEEEIKKAQAAAQQGVAGRVCQNRREHEGR